jgi:hypothetical protein
MADSHSTSDLQRCWACDEHKPLADFYRDRREPSGFARRCRECERERIKSEVTHP